MISLITRCPICGKESTINVHEHDYHKYQNGELVQIAFPYLSDADREKLITGTCEKCWDNMFNI